MSLQLHPAPSTLVHRWWIIGPSLVLPLLASYFYFVAYPGTTFGNSFYSGIKCWLFLAPIIATTVFFRERMVRRRPEKGARALSLKWGTIFGIAVVALMFGLLAWPVFGEVVRAGAVNIKEATDDLGVGGGKFLLFAVFISLIHSALEEFYWRWFVYGNLRHLVPKLWMAHLLAGVGFMAHHIVIVDRFFPLDFAIFLGVCVAIGGIFWSWLYERSHSLWGVWISHAIVDFGIFWIGYKLINS